MNKFPINNLIKSCDVVIAGGGIAGVCTALKLAKNNYKVVVLETKDDVLEGTSNRTPGRMGLGFHYTRDEYTAKSVLYKTIDFIKEFRDFFPECFIKGVLPEKWHFGLYAIAKNSLVSPEDSIRVYDSLTEVYKQIIEDPEYRFIKKYYGEVDEFYRILEPKNYPYLEHDNFALLIQTKEMLLDWKKFKSKLKKLLYTNPLITIFNNVKVEKIVDGTKPFYNKTIYFDCNNQYSSILSDFVVVSTWENIEEINKNSELKTSSVTNRLKILAQVELPEKLIFHPSVFFCTGPFAMFSNMGDRTGKITYAPVTNLDYSYEIPLPDEFKKILNNQGLFEDKKAKKKLGKEIIEGISKFIPEMKKVKLLRVEAGIVKQIHQKPKEYFDINHTNSNHHIRDYYGIEKLKDDTVINNAAIKLFYAVSNASQVLKIINNRRNIKPIFQSINHHKESNISPFFFL